jgi:predicted dehydrogenase
VLEHGKHLVCEKPLTTDSAQAAALVQLAGAHGVVAGVAYCYRYFPLVFQARHLVASGALGPVHQVRGLYLADELLHDQYFHYRFAPEIAGPSLAMADIGVHWCDLAEFVTGQRIVEVFADAHTVKAHREWHRGAPGAGPLPASGTGNDDSRLVPIAMEDCLSLLVHFDGGARGTLTVSQVSAGHKNWLTISVDGAAAGVDWNQEQPNTLSIRRQLTASEVLIKDPLLLAPDAARLARFPGGHPEGYPDAFRQCIASIYAAIDGSGEASAAPYPTLADGLRGVVMVESVLQSAAERRWVVIPAL